MSRSAEVHACLPLDSKAIQTRCLDSSHAVPNKPSNVVGFAFKVLDMLQESGEIRTKIATLEASGSEKLANIVALESQESQLIDDNRRLEHQLVTRLGLRSSVIKHGTCREQNVSPTPRLSSLILKRPRVCSKYRLPWIGPLCVVPSRSVTALKTRWTRRRQISKLQKCLLLLLLTTLSNIPGACRRPMLQCRNV